MNRFNGFVQAVETARWQMMTSPNTSLKRGVNDSRERQVEVRTYKFDGTLHRTWHAEFVRQEGSLIILDAKFPGEIKHDLLGTIASGTHSLEYYWLDRWYNIFRFAQPDGELRNYYCNVNMPPKLGNGVLSYVDLDLDILVNPDFSYQILDLEDFESNAQTYGYSDEVRTKARLAVDQLVEMIEARAFPFSEL